MKKTELISFGIPEEKVCAFQDAYWADVKKQAVRMAEADKGLETAPAPSAIREAIVAMVRLISDPVRLSLILSNVNRHYQTFRSEQDNSGKQPAMAQKGATECP